MVDTKELAKKEVEMALNEISRAADLLSSACGKLSRLEYCTDQWKNVGDHYDKTKELWHSVKQSIPYSKIDLDSDARRRVNGE